MEEEIEIETPDNHIIYGTLNHLPENNEALIIFVHGLTGHRHEHQFYNAARFFPHHGFATFRFDLYSGEKHGRSLSECTIETHASDVNTVVQHFRTEFKKIYLVGHSLGGPAILLAQSGAIESVVLWDPSIHLFEESSDEIAYDPRIDKYILQWGTEYMLSKEMIESWKRLGDELLSCFKKPTKIICAGQGTLYKDWQDKLKAINTNYDFYIVKDAGHGFDEGNTEDELFNETIRWFNG